MKKIIFAAAGLFMLSTLVVATPAQAAQGTTRTSISGPVTLLDGEVLWGAYLTVLHGVTANLDVGGESGFNYWSKSVGAASASLWAVPVLLTARYSFPLVDAPTFTPFVGAGLGLAVVHGSLSIGALSGSATEAKFEGLAHVGAKFGQTGDFFVDIRLGILDSAFAFAPTIGFTF